MDATSQVGWEAKDAIADNLKKTLVGIDVSLNRQRAQYNAHDKFVNKKDEEIDSMILENLRAYAKTCRDGWKDLINHEDEGIGLVCGHTNVSCVVEQLFFLIWRSTSLSLYNFFKQFENFMCSLIAVDANVARAFV